MPQPELLLMITPFRCSIMCGNAAFDIRKVPFRLTSICRSHSSSVQSTAVCGKKTPALLNNISRPLYAPSVSVTAWLHSSALRTSVRTKTALPPFLIILSVTARPRFSLRPVIVTLAPSFAKRIAVASPIPDVPPVISAILFSNRMVLIPIPPARRHPPPVRRQSQTTTPHWRDIAQLAQSPPACQHDREGGWPTQKEIDLPTRPLGAPRSAALQYQCRLGRCSLRECSVAHGQSQWLWSSVRPRLSRRSKRRPALHPPGPNRKPC